MANNVVLKSINLTSQWQPLSDEPLIADVTLMLKAVSGLVVINADMMIRSGSDIVRWIREKPVQLAGVDLSAIEVSSTFTDLQLAVIGNTR